MRKPVSLAPAGLSLKQEPFVAAPAAPRLPAQASVLMPADAPEAAAVQDIATAVQVAEASVDAPVASVAADLGQTVLDYWTQQADSLWSHGVTLSQARSVSDVIEAQGHFIRQQVEIARAQSATWSSLFNQTIGLSMAERLPAFSVWAPWQTTICKPGG